MLKRYFWCFSNCWHPGLTTPFWFLCYYIITNKWDDCSVSGISTYMKLCQLWTMDTFTNGHKIPATLDTSSRNSSPKYCNTPFSVAVTYPRVVCVWGEGVANFISAVVPPCLFTQRAKFNWLHILLAEPLFPPLYHPSLPSLSEF